MKTITTAIAVILVCTTSASAEQVKCWNRPELKNYKPATIVVDVTETLPVWETLPCPDAEKYKKESAGKPWSISCMVLHGHYVTEVIHSTKEIEIKSATECWKEDLSLFESGLALMWSVPVVTNYELLDEEVFSTAVLDVTGMTLDPRPKSYMLDLDAIDCPVVIQFSGEIILDTTYEDVEAGKKVLKIERKDF